MPDDEQSEFGSGIVVCLAKFSEHLDESMLRRYLYAQWWADASETEKTRLAREAERFPMGDAAIRVSQAKSVFLGIRSSTEEELLSALVTWANGASDHFYDLDDKAPPELKELADYMLELGHGKGLMGKWDETAKDTYAKIREMWEQACLAVDAMLGIEADWGRW